MLMHIYQRELSRRTGTEGPKHDPYSFTEMSVTMNGTTHSLHLGLGVTYTIDRKEVDPGPQFSCVFCLRGPQNSEVWKVQVYGEVVAAEWLDRGAALAGMEVEKRRRFKGDAREALLVKLWSEAVGMTPNQFERYYNRAHPYFDDPMGCAKDYE